jgi:hypothetical protein
LVQDWTFDRQKPTIAEEQVRQLVPKRRGAQGTPRRRQHYTELLLKRVYRLVGRLFHLVNRKIFFLIPKSKGLTRQDPDLIPKVFGITSTFFRDHLGINPETSSGFARDRVRDPLGKLRSFEASQPLFQFGTMQTMPIQCGAGEPVDATFIRCSKNFLR